MRRLRFSVALSASIVFALMAVSTRAARAQNFAVIHNFNGGQDGDFPYAGLTIDAEGNLYGTTAYGGPMVPGLLCGGAPYGCGVVFKLSNLGSGQVVTPIYSFKQGNDGILPLARVVFGPDGSLYGTTNEGGEGSSCPYGCGTVFRLTPPTTSCKNALCPWTETVLYRFQGNNDGANPAFGDLTFDQAGNLYGTTFYGGASSCNSGYGCGVIFKLTPSSGGWTETVLYRFTGAEDGGYPYSGLILDQNNNLYGTTGAGGFIGGNCAPSNGCGTVYQLTPSGSGWSITTLYAFQGGDDGGTPYGGLIFDPSGNLYGTTGFFGGQGATGTIFELARSGGNWIFSLLYDFGPPCCGNPVASMVMDSAGNLYGTTFAGGAYAYGSVFRLSHSGSSWAYTSLYDFTGGNDGANPFGNVTFDALGNLYGTTLDGGVHNKGVVWKITP